MTALARDFDMDAAAELGGDNRHISVLRAEVLAALAPKGGETHLDGTFGAGGYTRAILEAAPCEVVAIDRDPTAIAGGQETVREFAPRLRLIQGEFGDMRALCEGAGVEALDGIVLDIGVSSMQLDTADRGFSFRFEGPLDMRMGGEGPSAADLVNELAEKDLAALLRAFGEERRANTVARAIGVERAKGRIESTLHLARIVEGALGRLPDQIHPATRTFQALRIAVNDELGELLRALFAAEALLAPGGRLVVVSFHSLEDRIVKTFLADRSRTSSGVSRHAPATFAAAPTFIPIVRGSQTASDREIALNPRARSARLRAAERTDAPPRGEGDALAYGVPQVPALNRLLGRS